MPSQLPPVPSNTQPSTSNSNPLPIVGLVVSGIHVFSLQFVLLLAIFPFMVNDTGGSLPGWAWLFPLFFGLVVPAYMIVILVLSILSLKNHGAHAPRYKKPLKILLIVEGALVGLVILGSGVYTAMSYMTISQMNY